MTETHLDTPRGLSKQPGLTLTTRTWVGDYDALEAYAANLTVGRKVSGTSTSGVTDVPDGFLASAELAALNGKRGRLSLTIAKHQDNVEVWGLEPAEIQKPIRTWKANDPDDPPDLSALARWERLKDLEGGWEAYLAFQTDAGPATSSNTLEGNTLTLAQMILKGIEGYLVYTPVVTCVTRLNEIPDDIGAALGMVGAPTSNDPNMDGAVEKLAKLAKKWLKTADRIQGTLDGTYTRTQQWTGADDWDANLYADAAGDGEGGDEGDFGEDPDLGDTDLGDNPELRP